MRSEMPSPARSALVDSADSGGAHFHADADPADPADQTLWERAFDAAQSRAGDRQSTAMRTVEDERRRLRFLGDATALDRLVVLSDQVLRVRPESPETYVVAAKVAALRHRFTEAGVHLRSAQARGARDATVERMHLALQQIVGENASAVLAKRRLAAAASGALEDLVPLAAQLADLGEFEDAERSFLCALREPADDSPLVRAWISFQLGVLWSERMPAPDPERAARWYQLALDHLPPYALARAQLACVRLASGDPEGAEAVLRSPLLLKSTDPRIPWQLSRALAALGHAEEARERLAAAAAGFEALLGRHELAFAEPAARFFLGSGKDPRRAFELARAHLANRPTLRAFVLAHEAAGALGDAGKAARLAALGRVRWGHTKAFALSALSRAAASPPPPGDAATHA
jgi:tetratricopeptide (TPR) repeat protein